MRLVGAPRISIGYNVFFALIAMGLTLGLMQVGGQALILLLGGGLLLVGPLAAVGLYEVSRRLEYGETGGIRDVVIAMRNAPGQVGSFGAILGFAFFVWFAFLLMMLFLGTRGLPR